MTSRKTATIAIFTLSTLLTASLVPLSVSGNQGAKITSGKFSTYAAGIDRAYDITGRAMMIRTPNGKTIVDIRVKNLFPNTSYMTHVHNLPCNVKNGGGHYQHEVGGAVDEINEIWPVFTTNAAGIGNGFAKNDFYARPDAQSIVVHDTDGARIACADLTKK